MEFWDRRILGMVALGAWLVAFLVGIVCLLAQEAAGFVVAFGVWLFTLGLILGIPKWSEYDEWKRLKKAAGEWDKVG